MFSIDRGLVCYAFVLSTTALPSTYDLSHELLVFYLLVADSCASALLVATGPGMGTEADKL